MSDLSQIVAAMTPAEKAVAVRVLDAISRPLQVREIEKLLRAKGVPRPRAVKLAGTLKGFHIIAVAGPEHG